MTDDINATKEFQSVEDMSQTQTIPTKPKSTEPEVSDTKVFASVADDSQTQVLPTADDGQQTQVIDFQAAEPHDDEQPEADTIALQSVADVEEPDNAGADTTEATAVTTQSAEPAPETSVKPDLNVPLMEAFAQQTAAPSQSPDVAPDNADTTDQHDSHDKSDAPAPAVAAAAPVTAAEIQHPKRKASVPTIIFGTLGMVIGVIGLLFGWSFPGLLIESFYIDPRVLTAIICGGVGVVLVIVAIIWAVMGSRKKQTGEQ
ncbi:hypothetical protein [Bifidobacterium felsineum]|uniref:Uncharacterized protein n=1 Tax=Bifidobacterium felsineum TaxID=2045440 RepID=A0A2M9HM96_9BIFI|nr:hypothetical protein [Bifidobacterium felsineum]MBT1163397.1 hypothetical protein [Bifidobacterium felsineum]PJM77926.1 hypothetical protein CSQ86_02455 [Bifidobacterium felsineum]